MLIPHSVLLLFDRLTLVYYADSSNPMWLLFRAWVRTARPHGFCSTSIIPALLHLSRSLSPASPVSPITANLPPSPVPEAALWMLSISLVVDSPSRPGMFMSTSTKLKGSFLWTDSSNFRIASSPDNAYRRGSQNRGYDFRVDALGPEELFHGEGAGIVVVNHEHSSRIRLDIGAEEGGTHGTLGDAATHMNVVHTLIGHGQEVIILDEGGNGGRRVLAVLGRGVVVDGEFELAPLSQLGAQANRPAHRVGKALAYEEAQSHAYDG